jgi:acyl carrier protein
MMKTQQESIMPTEAGPDNIEERVIRVIAETQKISPELIDVNKTFEELKIDSLDGINIVFALENEFSVNIPDEGVETMSSVRQAVEGIRKLVEAQ